MEPIKKKNRSDIAHYEMTRDPIFLFQKRAGKQSNHWFTELVFLTREEANEYGHKHNHNYPNGWQVYCVPADGSLIALLKRDDVCTWTMADYDTWNTSCKQSFCLNDESCPEENDMNFCSYCGLRLVQVIPTLAMEGE